MAYNAAMPALVQQRAAAGKHVQLVNMYGTFTAHADYKTSLMTMTCTRTRPDTRLLGHTWYTVISSFLPPAGP